MIFVDSNKKEKAEGGVRDSAQHLLHLRLLFRSRHAHQPWLSDRRTVLAGPAADH